MPTLSIWRVRLQEWAALHWALIFIMGVLSTLLGFTIAIFLLINLSPVFSQPLKVTVIDAGISGPVCPGDTVQTTVEGIVDGGIFVDILWGYTTQDNQSTVIGSFDESFFQLPGKKTTVRRTFTWIIPDFAAGQYTAVRGYHIRGRTLYAQYVQIPFDIAEDCF